MNCDCPDCHELAEDLRANSEALRALHDDPLPPFVIRTKRQRRADRWRIAAAAAFLLAISLPVLSHKPASSPSGRLAEPLKVKLLTPDPNVVIYWLIDPKENDSQ